jgi:cytochrome c peroxidase
MTNVRKFGMLIAGGVAAAILIGERLTAADRPGHPAPLAALPPLSAPSGDPAGPERIELGKMLFFDPRLSGDGSISCADCHSPRKGWGDGNDLSRGYPGTVHWRNSQTIVNSAYLSTWFWTSSATTLEEQAKSAMTGPLAGNMNTRLAEERLKQVPEYVALFKKVYDDKPTIDNALSAIAAFERTVVSIDSPFDRYMRGDRTALTDQQVRGKALFEGKAGCIACHNGPLLSDQKFHNIGVPPNPAFETDPQRQIAMRERIKSKGIGEEVYLKFDRDPGHFLDTKKSEDLGKFRTPPLRYLAHTAPYMHNGSLFTLEEVIDFYDRGGDHDPFATKSAEIRRLGLSAVEKAELLAFLEGLSGSELLVEPPGLPPYRALKFPMLGQW